MNLTFDKFREVNVKRCESSFHKLNDWSTNDWATALAGEAGEACNFAKKLRRLDSRPQFTKETDLERGRLIGEIGKELADVVTYCDLLAASLGISLGQAVADKFNEVSDRVGSEIKLTEDVYETTSVADDIRKFQAANGGIAIANRNPLSKLLCLAAGVDPHGVTAITCRCACNELVQFTVEKYGENDDIQQAIAT